MDSPPLLQYALMLKLPASAIQRVKELQQAFRSEFDFPNALISHPHITLAYWDMNPQLEARLFPRLEIQASETAPQRIFFNGFDQLSGAFCVRIENGEILADQIFKKKGYFRRRLKVETAATKVEFINKLHITIARKLTLGQLKQVAEEWKARHFQQEILADRMVLIKYLPGGEKKAIAEYVFSGTGSDPVGNETAVQTTLF